MEAHRAADPARQIGPPGGLDGFHRATAAGALDDADDRQAKLGGHLLGHQRLLANGGIGGAAPHGEIVAHHHDRPAVDARTAKYAVRRRELLKLVLRVVTRPPGDRADFMEAAGIDQRVDPLAYGEPPAVVLALDLVGPAHGARHALAAPQLLELALPVHRRVSPRRHSRRTAVIAMERADRTRA